MAVFQTLLKAEGDEMSFNKHISTAFQTIKIWRASLFNVCAMSEKPTFKYISL